MSDGHEVLPPALPHTWRPLRARIVGFLACAVIAGGAVVLAIALPRSSGFHGGDRAGVVIMGLLAAGVPLLLTRPRLSGDQQGLHVVNLLRSRRVAWTEVVAVDLAETESWACLDLTDGTALPVLALQTADRERFRRGVAELQALVARHSGTDPGRVPD